MSAYGYDAAYPPDPAVVKAAGGQIMAVYLTGRYAVPAGWVARIHKAGLGALANYEEAAAELVTAGHMGGQAIGSRAMAAAIAKGFLANGTEGIYYSVDVNVPPSKFAAVGVAFDGINDVTRGAFITHVYGEGALIDYLVSTGRVRRAQWLSASKSYPGYNAQSPNVGLVQLVGSNIPNTDQNLITNAAGLDVFWPAGVEAPSGSGVPIITATDWLDMATQAEVTAIIRTELATALSGLRSDVDKIQWGVLDSSTGTRVKANQAATSSAAALAAYSALIEQVKALSGTPSPGTTDLQAVLAKLDALPAELRAAIKGAAVTGVVA